MDTKAYVKWYMSDVHACGVVRANDIASAIMRRYDDLLIDCKNLIVPADYIRATAMVYQRQITPGLVGTIRDAKARGIRTIFDLDDDLFNIPPEIPHVYKQYADPKIRAAIVDNMRACDIVTVATPELERRMLSMGFPDVRVVRNAIDAAYWTKDVTVNRNPESGKGVIGWMASGTHNQDLPIVKEALEIVLTTYPGISVEVIGSMNPMLFADLPRVTTIPWTSYTKIPEIMAKWDIAIAPLADTLFNRAKSEIKALQYWALRLPVVASGVEPYRCLGLEGGILLAHDRDEWVSHLSKLIFDIDFRTQLGHHGFRNINRDSALSLWSRCAEWRQLFI